VPAETIPFDIYVARELGDQVEPVASQVILRQFRGILNHRTEQAGQPSIAAGAALIELFGLVEERRARNARLNTLAGALRHSATCDRCVGIAHAWNAFIAAVTGVARAASAVGVAGPLRSLCWCTRRRNVEHERPIVTPQH